MVSSTSAAPENVSEEVVICVRATVSQGICEGKNIGASADNEDSRLFKSVLRFICLFG